MSRTITAALVCESCGKRVLRRWARTPDSDVFLDEVNEAARRHADEGGRGHTVRVRWMPAAEAQVREA